MENEISSLDGSLNDKLCKKIAQLMQDSLVKYKESTNEIGSLISRSGEALDETQQLVAQTEDAQLYAVVQKLLGLQTEMTTRIVTVHDRISTLEQQVATLSNEARLDPLTRILNRLALDKDLDRFVSQPTENTTLAIIDIDDFKKINDTYGHPVGDKVLRFLGGLLGKESDYAYRYGGEEFVMIFTGITLEQASEKLNNILDQTRRFNLIVGANKLHISFSAGVAMLQLNESKDNLIKRADDALYEAKREGKNQIRRG